MTARLDGDGSDRPHPSAQDTGGAFIIGGDVKQPGEYGFYGRKVTLKRALVFAGGLADTSQPAYIRVFRAEGNHEAIVVSNCSYLDLISGAQNDMVLHDQDIIYIRKSDPWPGAATQQSIKP